MEVERGKSVSAVEVSVTERESHKPEFWLLWGQVNFRKIDASV